MIINIYLEIAEEAKRLELIDGLEKEAALRVAKEMYSNKIKEGEIDNE